MNSGRLVVLSACVLFLQLAVASEPDDAPVEWNLTLDQVAIQQALEKAEKYGSHHTTEQLFLRREFDFRHGEVVTRARRIWRFPSVGAIQDFGADSIYFDANRDVLRIEMAASIAPDGKAVSLAPSDAHVRLEDEPAVYTDMRRVDLWYPGLEPGSLAIVDYTVRSNLRDAESIWSSRQLLQNLYPRREIELAGRWNDSFSPRWTDGLQGLECISQPNQFTCSGHELAAIKYEEGILWLDVIPEFVISLAPSWHAVIDLASRRFQEALGDLGSINQVLSPLLKDAGTAEEKISRIHEYAARGIRYVSVSRHGNRITPKSVANTLESRFGDCKDKSALLVAMLAEAGIESYPVLIATDRTRLANPDLADMHYFDHMVVCLEEQKHCLDPTDNFTSSTATSPWIQGKVALALKPGAGPSTVEANQFRWALDIDGQFRFDSDGNQTETLIRTYKGEYAGAMRAILQSLSGPDRDEWAREQYQNTVGSSVEPTFTFSGVDELSDHLVIHSEATYSRILDVEPTVSYREMPLWIQSELHSMVLAETSHFRTFNGVHVTAKHRFSFPQDWEILFGGAALDFENEFGLYRRTGSISGNEIIYDSTLELPYRGGVDSETASRINTMLNTLSQQSAFQLIARMGAVP